MSTVDLTRNSDGLGDFIVNARNAIASGSKTIILPQRLRRFGSLLEGVCGVEIKIESGDGGFPNLTANEMEECAAFTRPVCLKRYCSPAWSRLRQIDQSRWVPLVRKLLSDGFTVLDFGISGQFSSLEIASDRYIPQIDLPLRAIASRLKKSGVYIGLDTGEMHLAFQVGCQMWVIRPDETPDYLYKDWEYRDGRVHYFNVNTELTKVYDSFSASRSRTP